MSTKKTADFVTALSQDPKLKEEWKRDPDGTMDKAGLSEEGKAALKSGDADKVREYLGEDSPPGCLLI